jgi:hypothetical protein
MRVKVTERQYQILLDNFNVISDRGFYLSIQGKTFKKFIKKLGCTKNRL